MDHSYWTDQLSDFLDGELPAKRAREVREHLRACEACRRATSELEAVVQWAASYQPPVPSDDGWPALRRRIEEGKTVAFPPARNRFGWSALIAAGLVMATVTGGGVWMLTRVTPEPAVVSSPERLGPPVMVETSTGEVDVAVRELEVLLRENRSGLDTATVRVVEQSLRTIDQAIAEARAAVQRDSSLAYLNGRIAAQLRQKLDILRTATRAMHAET